MPILLHVKHHSIPMALHSLMEKTTFPFSVDSFAVLLLRCAYVTTIDLAATYGLKVIFPLYSDYSALVTDNLDTLQTYLLLYESCEKEELLLQYKT